ncbi:type IV secretion system protein VirB8 [Phaeovulum vinaykumarii]|uniref:Type IV secretion system protein VirB8 n=2 Tax=Phaeovulum vinaykumarii TaxID=407234 RepID=A0A1N7MX42_9RHOB|nr:type IV secretion system protein VirB8 [Phaeovulum vinaykumarii]SOC16146.1 type IV secretion system protein VirB8 [Phaeovulum vinaykumarii]
MSGVGEMSAREIVEEELVYGALRREQQWRLIGLGGAGFGVFGCLAAAAIALMVETPPPVVVPYDPATGLALPNATVETVRLSERPAIIEAQIYRYVLDREVYNQLDNDLRVRRVLSQSTGAAEASMRAMWTSGQENYPPTRYGSAAEMSVEIASITLIGGNRAQVRLRKRLTGPQGTQEGLFSATLMFSFQPERTRSIDDVWQNPFGFTVTQYAIRSDRSE